jgi:transglutaminase-like putative cysteine protease
MIYKISHRTTYKYASLVSFGNHVACLKPRTWPSHRLTRHELIIQPTPTICNERVDYFGNVLCFFTVQEPHKILTVESRSEVELDGDQSNNTEVSLPWEESTLSSPRDDNSESLEARQFQFESPRIRKRAEYAAYAIKSFAPGRPMKEALLDLTGRIHQDFRFDGRVTNVRTATEEVFKKRRGVCQDFAHMQIACLRSLGLAARYVSGYLRTYPPPGKSRLVGADASHAWLSAYCKGVGWIDLDPTNNVVPYDGHATIAWGRDYGDVSPLRGLILGGRGHSLEVAVDMEPVEVSGST